MKKQIKPIVALEVNEVCFANKIAKMLSYQVESIPNNKGKFSAIKLTSENRFKREEIKIILDKFSERFNKHLTFENCKNNTMFNVGYLSISKSI